MCYFGKTTQIRVQVVQNKSAIFKMNNPTFYIYYVFFEMQLKIFQMIWRYLLNLF